MQSDSSNLLGVGYLRFLQHLEKGPRKNPDYFVHHFLPRKPWYHSNKKDIRHYRKEPFYHYLLARTLYYDKLFCDGIKAGAKQILLVGAGTDTRAYRFGDLLAEHGAYVLEADQPQPSREKKAIAQTLPTPSNISFIPLDIHSVSYDEWATKAQLSKEAQTLVLMEGVSPYIRQDAFLDLLRFLSHYLKKGSSIIYCHKLLGMDDEFGSDIAGAATFRLDTQHDKIIAQHQLLNLCVRQNVDPHEIIDRYITYKPEVSIFTEDGIIKCETI